MYVCCSDDPNEMPTYVASNEAADGCTIKPHGDNIFAAIWYSTDYELTARHFGKTVGVDRVYHVVKTTKFICPA